MSMCPNKSLTIGSDAMEPEDIKTIKELEALHKHLQIGLNGLFCKIQELKKECHSPDDDSHYCKDTAGCRYGMAIGPDDYEETCECYFGEEE